MKPKRFACVCFLVGSVVLALAVAGPVPAIEDDPRLTVSIDPTGQVATLDTNGSSDLENPFFQDLGTNGRRCVTCHQPANAWTITPENVQARFFASRGADPIFTNNDGSNCEGATAGSLAAKRDAYSLLLTRGLIRVGRDVLPGAEFAIDHVSDPNRCGPATNDASLYRRPLPATNLRFLSAVMWDGRESSPTTTILQDLAHQANDATLGHAQASHDITPDEAQQIVAFETGLFTTQLFDRQAGRLDARGARGGPRALSPQAFFTGINDPVGLNPSGAVFDPNVFTVFNAWANAGQFSDERLAEARQAISRGEQIFNARFFTISGVGGLNGETFASGVSVPGSMRGTCTVCHDTPNAGDHSVKAPLNIGLADPARAPYLPIYTLRNIATQETVETTDPGRAMISGKWKDIGKFKGPILRGLAARAPYFHNGSAATFDDVIDFYESRFHIGLTPRERADLIAFLRSL